MSGERRGQERVEEKSGENTEKKENERKANELSNLKKKYSPPLVGEEIKEVREGGRNQNNKITSPEVNSRVSFLMLG